MSKGLIASIAAAILVAWSAREAIGQTVIQYGPTVYGYSYAPAYSYPTYVYPSYAYDPWVTYGAYPAYGGISLGFGSYPSYGYMSYYGGWRRGYYGGWGGGWNRGFGGAGRGWGGGRRWGGGRHG